ncbi:OsmC family protein [Alteromonas oceanisediminis]|uniref:OsmC family protein n=1 Tax=Alteromonas oceanisediminis TaxID=2836180 RepID=UPI001BD95D2B|nr:OsmC family protein [Alteromonas oceanisediminis]MBT0586624.1 OsmC family protein [Alteromonas oceanisediminis]
MSMKNSATATYKGLGKEGKGTVTTQSGALSEQPYGFNTRFEDEKGTNPEEQIAAAHASCFAMALSFGLAEKGFTDGTLNIKALVTLVKEGDGFKVASSELTLSGDVEGLDMSDFEKAANDAKQNCPISKLLNCDISLTIESFS